MRKIKPLRIEIFLLLIVVLLSGTGFVRAEYITESSSSIITANDIQREHPSSITNLLHSRAGIDDASGTITMRGVQGVAVMLNGRPSSLYDLDQLNLNDIERIEIIRGASSGRFGANAMSGAIVVTTRLGAERPVLKLSGSSTGSLGTNFGGDLVLESWQLGMALKDENVHGYPSVPYAPYPDQITVEAEHVRNKSVAIHANYQHQDDSIGMEVKHAEGKSFFGRPNVWEELTTTSGRINAKTTLASGVEVEMRAGRESVDDLNLMDIGSSADAAGLIPDRNIVAYDATNDAEMVLSWKGVATGLRAGSSYLHTSGHTSINPYASSSQIFVLDTVTIDRAIFAHLDRRIGGSVEVAVDGRYDRYEYPEIFVFDAQGNAPPPGKGAVKQSFNPKFEAHWHASESTTLNASYGTGFVPPSPEQLYYSYVSPAAWLLANSALKPQHSNTQDVGVSVKQGTEWSVSASLFHTKWTDKIGITILDYGIPFKQQFANIGAVESNGVEIDSMLRLTDSWSATLNYTYNNSRIVRDQAHPEWVGNSQPDTPRHKLNVALAYEDANVTGRLAMRGISKTFSDDANTVTDTQGYRWEKGAYTIFDATLTHHFHDVDITVSIDNLVDRKYVSGFFRLGQPRQLRIESSWRL